MNLRHHLCLAASVIAFSQGFASPVHAQDALSEFRAFTKDLSSLTGAFTQEVRDKNGRVTRTSAGNFSIVRPGKFRFTYDKPYKQTIVSDGVTVWLHDHDLNQVTIRKIGEALAEQPLALLLDPQSAEKQFELKAAPAQGSIKTVVATAKKTDASVSEIAVALVAAQPSEIAWRDSWQNVNTLRFASLARNAKVDPESFNFVVPKGADVLKQ